MNSNIPDIILPDITTGSLHRRVLLDWTLPPDYAMCLEKYYLLHWSRPWLERQMHKKLIHQSVPYVVISMPNQLISDALQSDQIAISFRKMYSMAYGYAMIRAIGNT